MSRKKSAADLISALMLAIMTVVLWRQMFVALENETSHFSAIGTVFIVAWFTVAAALVGEAAVRRAIRDWDA